MGGALRGEWTGQLCRCRGSSCWRRLLWHLPRLLGSKGSVGCSGKRWGQIKCGVSSMPIPLATCAALLALIGFHVPTRIDSTVHNLHAQAHFARSMGFSSSLQPAPVASGHGVASGGCICASNVASRVHLRYEPQAQMDGASFQRMSCQCGCANAAMKLCTQCGQTASACS